MRQPISPAAPRSSRLRRLPLVLLVIAILAGIVALVRATARPPEAGEPAARLTAKQRSGYRNRAILSHAPDTPVNPAESPKVTGTVYDADGNPVSGAHLSATTFQVAGNQSTVAGTAESDAGGRFELHLPTGSYYLKAEKETFTPALSVARSGDEIGIVLAKSGVVEGTVVNEQGEPINRFTIDVLTSAADDMAAPAPFASKHFESSKGFFRIEEIPDQGVFLRATAADYAPQVSAMLQTKPGETQNVSLTLSLGCAISGTVEDQSGVPLQDVFIDAELRRSAGTIGPTSLDAARQAESDAEGRFRLEHVPIGTVMFRAYDGDHAVTTAEMGIQGCDNLLPVRLRMGSGSVLSGRVQSSDDKPVAGAKLTLTHRSIGFVSAVSDKDGRYRFEKLPPGGMRLEAQQQGRMAVVMVNVTEGKDVEKNVVFPAAGKGELRGRVTASGKPLAGMQLLVAANPGTGVLDSRQPVTGADGTFRLTDLAEGTYVVILASAGRMTSAHVEPGGVANVELDAVATLAPPPKPSELRARTPQSPNKDAPEAQPKGTEGSPEGPE